MMHLLWNRTAVILILFHSKLQSTPIVVNLLERIILVQIKEYEIPLIGFKKNVFFVGGGRPWSHWFPQLLSVLPLLLDTPDASNEYRYYWDAIDAMIVVATRQHGTHHHYQEHRHFILLDTSHRIRSGQNTVMTRNLLYKIFRKLSYMWYVRDDFYGR